MVIASGNHFWLDAVLGLATAALAVGVATLLARVNPDWSFGPRRRGERAGELEGQTQPEAAPA